MRKTLIALAFTSAAGSALAQAPGGFTPPTFDGLDTDKNGSLSQAEVEKFVATIPAGGPNGPPNAATVFGNWDADKNGSVSREEFDKRPRPAGAGR
jgi:Ca2+-binding EF-hand superfamily protein